MRMWNRSQTSKKVLLILYSLLLFLVVLCFLRLDSRYHDSPAFLISGSDGETILRFPGYDLELSGIDRKGCTCFFLPAFVSLTDIDQSLSEYRLYLPDGSLLKKPLLEQPIDVMVDTGSTEYIPWKIAFYRSENICSVFLDINADDPALITKEKYEDSSVNVVTPEGHYILKNEPVLVKGHGNSTWDIDKNPYEMKFSYEIPIGNMQASNKWVLLANVYDGTKMADKLAFDTSAAIGMEYSIESDWVDLYAGRTYLGNYLLCKEPDIGRDALDIADLEAINDPFWDPEAVFSESDMKGFLYQDPPAYVSGGYLIEKNRPTLYEEKKCGFQTENDCFTIKSPNNASYEDVDYIASFTGSVDSSIRGDSSGQLSMIDISTFTRRFLIEDLFFNSDAMCSSYFFYKKPDQDRLYAGPVWDHDRSLGFGNVEFFMDPSNSVLDIGTWNSYADAQAPLDWDLLLYDNDEYRSYLIKVFSENLPVFKELIEERIDSDYHRIEKSLKMDYILWGMENCKYRTAYNNIRFIKYYLSKRLDHMCDIWNVDSDLHYEISDGSEHRITFILPDGNNLQIMADDGSFLSPEELPAHDTEIKMGWFYSGTENPYSRFIPIWEDTALELRPLPTD